jgi:hypothetical protein
MGVKTDRAWRTAARCARLAQEADDDAEREFYRRMRDAWISVANRCEFLETAASASITEQFPKAEGAPTAPFIPLGPRAR